MTTAANAADISQIAGLLHGKETVVGADAGYVGAPKREDVQKKLQENERRVDGRIARRRKPIKAVAEDWKKQLAQACETLKARVRAIVEHPFHAAKNIFKHKKARYKGLAKNHAQHCTLFALSNLYMVRAKLRPWRVKWGEISE